MIYDSPYRTAGTCTAVTGSMTLALKAQRALARETIRSSTVKVSRSIEGRGCVYGIEFDCPLLGNVKATLDRAGIEVKEFLR